MRRQTLALVIGLISLAVGIVLAKFSPARVEDRARPAPEVKQDWRANDYRLSGPYAHRNLTVFLVHGEDGPGGKPFLTLQEAMERKLVIVHETSEVNELAVENVSATDEVFIQSGDIVKGGQQDRVLAVDLIVPPRSGRMPIDAFCVEQGRWHGRGNEAAARFSSSDTMAATKELKMAAKHANSQSQVWGEVAKAQEKLGASTNANVRSPASTSSYQLSLENEKVRETSDGYVRSLSPAVEGKADVIGYVFAVNGRVSSADIYASRALFVKLWPKLLKASAVEAVAERTADAETSAATSAEMIGDFFADAEKGRETSRDVTKRTRMIKREGEKGIFFETRDMARGRVWVHRNYLNR